MEMESCRLFKGDNFIFPPCRRLLSLLGFVHNRPTSRLPATKTTKKKKKRKPVFIKRKWNHVVFSRATILSFHPVEGYKRSWDLYTTGQLVDGQQEKKESRFSLNGNGIMSSFLG